MKKTLAAITAIVLALGLSAVGASSANATSASDNTTPSSDSTTSSTSTDQANSASADTATTVSPAAPVVVATSPVVAQTIAPVIAPPAVPAPRVAPAMVHASPTKTTSAIVVSCVPANDVVWMYIFTAATASGDITASADGAAIGQKLCTPLYVRSATWKYDLLTSGTPTSVSFPQTLDGSQLVTIDSIGTRHYAAPNVSTCRQYDIYASFAGKAAVDVPSKLLGPANPYEPPFLHTTLKGHDANNYPTSATNTTVGCTKVVPVATIVHGLCYWDNGQKGSFETVGLVYDNSGSDVPVKFALQSYPQYDVDNSAYDRTVAAGAVLTVPVQASWTGGVSYNVIANGVTTTLAVPSFVSCAPGTVGDSTIEAPAPVTSTDVCGTTNDAISIPTLSADDHYTYSTVDNRNTEGVGTVVVTAKPATGYVFAADAVSSWTLIFGSDAANSCVFVPHDPIATPQTCSEGESQTLVSGAITVFGAAGLSYTIHKTDSPAVADIVVADGVTSVPVGQYTVTASAKSGFKLDSSVSPVTQFAVANNAVDCQLAVHAFIQPSVSWSGQSCTSGTTTSGYVAITPGDGLTYFVGSTQLVSAKTAFAPGSYTVTVVAQPGNSIDGASTIPLTITPSASCGKVSSSALGTLAFTGFTGGSTYIIVASFLLLIGAVFVFASTRRRSDDEI